MTGIFGCPYDNEKFIEPPPILMWCNDCEDIFAKPRSKVDKSCWRCGGTNVHECKTN